MKILDFNHCNLPDCKCGWNVLLGGVSDKELNQLRKFLAGKVTADETKYADKVGTEKF